MLSIRTTKLTFLALSSFVILITLQLNSCVRTTTSGEGLARTYCGSCHVYADPSLLDKDTWQNSVLPRMALRLGFITDTSSIVRYMTRHEELQKGIKGGYMPGQPILSESNWQQIVDYYVQNAPAKMPSVKLTQPSALTLFQSETPTNPILPITTLVSIDPTTRTLRAGNRRGDLLTYDATLRQTDSTRLSSPPADLVRVGKSTDWTYLLMGIMDPNDDRVGQIWSGNRPQLDSLRRPVQMTSADLDRDGQMDWVVCEFGHNIGRLTAHFKQGNAYREVVLDMAPGARRAIVRDLNADGWPDVLALMTQGDEQVAAYYNQENGRFRKEILVKFPPVYGSSYFELADVNNDSHPDLICTAGDNADYSQVPKTYHGIRVFLNDGTFHFSKKENYFYPMPGAQQVLARDFDRDGDVDLAAISFFPLLDKDRKQPAQVFVYLENRGKLAFEPRTWAGADNSRWMVMDAGDVDGDGDEDIALGAFYREESLIPPAWDQFWFKSRQGVVVLRNRAIK
jgi:hypothetical protein